MSDDIPILYMSDFVVSYRPKPACLVREDVIYVHRPNVATGKPAKKLNPVESVNALANS